jgi:hypothetical protein
MKRVFEIYKKGTTDRWITILIPTESYSLDLIQSKMEMYLNLGYDVKLIYETETI